MEQKITVPSQQFLSMSIDKNILLPGDDHQVSWCFYSVFTN